MSYGNNLIMELLARRSAAAEANKALVAAHGELPRPPLEALHTSTAPRFVLALSSPAALVSAWHARVERLGVADATKRAYRQHVERYAAALFEVLRTATLRGDGETWRLPRALFTSVIDAVDTPSHKGGLKAFSSFVLAWDGPPAAVGKLVPQPPLELFSAAAPDPPISFILPGLSEEAVKRADDETRSWSWDSAILPPTIESATLLSVQGWGAATAGEGAAAAGSSSTVCTWRVEADEDCGSERHKTRLVQAVCRDGISATAANLKALVSVYCTCRWRGGADATMLSSSGSARWCSHAAGALKTALDPVEQARAEAAKKAKEEEAARLLEAAARRTVELETEAGVEAGTYQNLQMTIPGLSKPKAQELLQQLIKKPAGLKLVAETMAAKDPGRNVKRRRRR